MSVSTDLHSIKNLSYVFLWILDEISYVLLLSKILIYQILIILTHLNKISLAALELFEIKDAVKSTNTLEKHFFKCFNKQLREWVFKCFREMEVVTLLRRGHVCARLAVASLNRRSYNFSKYWKKLKKL